MAPLCSLCALCFLLLSGLLNAVLKKGERTTLHSHEWGTHSVPAGPCIRPTRHYTGWAEFFGIAYAARIYFLPPAFPPLRDMIYDDAVLETCVFWEGKTGRQNFKNVSKSAVFSLANGCGEGKEGVSYPFPDSLVSFLAFFKAATATAAAQEDIPH